MGHEFTGHVYEVGSSVKQLKVGDHVVTPFTTSCGECFYCKRGFSSRCIMSQLFGCPTLDGAQAEYVRVPLADTTAVKAPEGIKDEALVLMGDIFPTGFFAAKNGFQFSSPEEIKESVVVLIGCGPVALCSLVSITDYSQNPSAPNPGTSKPTAKASTTVSGNSPTAGAPTSSSKSWA
jgi:threonine dehydrogenase-like Zn-dependent dehydrogenase